MGRYAVAVRRLALELMGVIVESLGLGRTYMKAKMEDGIQVMVVNSYPTCGHPEAASPPMPAVGMPTHTDYSNITVLLQSNDGLQVLDAETGRWTLVPAIPGALYVQVGNHLEVLSNGRYRSPVHRAVLNPSAARLSVASLHSVPMGEKMGVAAELLQQDGTKRYRESSFEEFLEFVSWNELGKGRSFMDTLKLM
ncbi:hypothetical protein Taro_007635 [Colocasia esculenta]|uniref:Fe2OG dioxygenase domain-containing protein n=1 Tax=Colocasia esculenta TaxID=4460 RepID=A0A843TZH6_COLES|nr:hypothetical protein [Colocasia esculenta]